MTLVFTFPGFHGAMLHSGAALLPWLSITCIEGLERVTKWAAKRLPHWDAAVAFPRFAVLLVSLSAVLSYALVLDRSTRWNRESDTYRAMAGIVLADDAAAVPLLNDPPAWWYVTRSPAMLNPSNGPDAAFAAARAFGGTHLILEPERSREWQEFARSGAADPRLTQLASQNGYVVYRLVLP